MDGRKLHRELREEGQGTPARLQRRRKREFQLGVFRDVAISHSLNFRLIEGDVVGTARPSAVSAAVICRCPTDP